MHAEITVLGLSIQLQYWIVLILRKNEFSNFAKYSN